VARLVALAGEPGPLWAVEYRIQHHQSLDQARRRRVSTEAAVRFADEPVEALVVEVEQPTTMLRTRLDLTC
jgi:hypothetical protein